MTPADDIDEINKTSTHFMLLLMQRLVPESTRLDIEKKIEAYPYSEAQVRVLLKRIIRQELTRNVQPGQCPTCFKE